MAAWSQTTSEAARDVVQGRPGIHEPLGVRVPPAPSRMGRPQRRRQHHAKSLIAGARDPRAYLAPFVPGTLESPPAPSSRPASARPTRPPSSWTRLFGTEVADNLKVAMEYFWLHKTEQLHASSRCTAGTSPPKSSKAPASTRSSAVRPPTPRSPRGLFDEAGRPAHRPRAEGLAEAMVARGQDGRLASFRDGLARHGERPRELRQEGHLQRHDGEARRRRPLAARRPPAGLEEGRGHPLRLLEDHRRRGQPPRLLPLHPVLAQEHRLLGRAVATKPWLTRRVRSTTSATATRPTRTGPSWMRRYVNMQEIADAASFVPGLQWLVDNTGCARAVRPALLLVVQHLLPRLEGTQRQPRRPASRARLPRPDPRRARPVGRRPQPVHPQAARDRRPRLDSEVLADRLPADLVSPPPDAQTSATTSPTTSSTGSASSPSAGRLPPTRSPRTSTSTSSARWPASRPRRAEAAPRREATSAPGSTPRTSGATSPASTSARTRPRTSTSRSSRTTSFTARSTTSPRSPRPAEDLDLSLWKDSPRSCGRTRSPSTATPPPSPTSRPTTAGTRLRRQAAAPQRAPRDHPVRRPALLDRTRLLEELRRQGRPLHEGRRVLRRLTPRDHGEAPLRRQADGQHLARHPRPRAILGRQRHPRPGPRQDDEAADVRLPARPPEDVLLPPRNRLRRPPRLPARASRAEHALAEEQRRLRRL
jgi:hypothetical protein